MTIATKTDFSATTRLLRAVEHNPEKTITSCSSIGSCPLWDKVCCLKEKPSCCLPICLAAKEVLDEGCCECRNNRAGLGYGYNQPIFVNYGGNRHFLPRHHGNGCELCFNHCGSMTRAAKDVLCLPVKGCAEAGHIVAGCCGNIGDAVKECECKACTSCCDDIGKSCHVVAGVVTAVCGAVYEAIKAAAGVCKAAEPVVSMGCHSLAAKVGGTHVCAATAGCALTTCCFNSFLQCQTILDSEKEHMDGPKDQVMAEPIAIAAPTNITYQAALAQPQPHVMQ